MVDKLKGAFEDRDNLSKILVTHFEDNKYESETLKKDVVSSDDVQNIFGTVLADYLGDESTNFELPNDEQILSKKREIENAKIGKKALEFDQENFVSYMYYTYRAFLQMNSLD